MDHVLQLIMLFRLGSRHQYCVIYGVIKKDKWALFSYKLKHYLGKPNKADKTSLSSLINEHLLYFVQSLDCKLGGHLIF